MKRFVILFLALTAFTSCEKPDGTEGPDQEGPFIIDEFPSFFAGGVYKGDIYGEGTGYVEIDITDAEIQSDEEEGVNVTGLHSVFSFSLNIPLAKNPDNVTIPTGVYTMAEEGTHAAGTWNIDFNTHYLGILSDGEAIDVHELISGNFAISRKKNRYTIMFFGETENGHLETKQICSLKFRNKTSEGRHSNIDRDIEVGGLTHALMEHAQHQYGYDVETWRLELRDRHFLMSSIGSYIRPAGNWLELNINTRPGLRSIPPGRYDRFVGHRDLDTTAFNTLLKGPAYHDSTFVNIGCFYDCMPYSYLSFPEDGYVDIELCEDNEYAISGELKDGFGHKVTFSYKGEVENPYNQ